MRDINKMNDLELMELLNDLRKGKMLCQREIDKWNMALLQADISIKKISELLYMKN